MLSVATDAQAHDELRLDLEELVREGARRMLAAALEAEVDDYLTAHAAERDEGGRRLVVRNGHARQREVLTAAGAIPVRAPRVDDRRTDLVTGERIRFRSVILPPWCRKSPKVAEVLPLLYLHGLSTGDSPRRWRRSSARRRGCQPRPSVGCLAPGRPTTKPSASVTWPGGTMGTSGPMGSTSGSV
jgi:transposase-like protein